MSILREGDAAGSNLYSLPVSLRETAQRHDSTTSWGEKGRDVSDPSKLDISDYFAAIVAAGVAGIGGAMAWFNNSKKDLNKRMNDFNDRLDDHFTQDEERHREHSVGLATMQTNQENMHKGLDAVQRAIERSAAHGAEEVNKMFLIVLEEIQRNRKP
jgi:hypothetical protein